jgi:hypothetical protein
MAKSDYNRRDLFKTFGASAMLLHPIISMRDIYAQEAVKKRFVCMLTSSGVIQANFWPKGTADSYDFAGTSLEPLSSFKSDLTIVKGLNNDYGPYDSHSGGAVSLLTGDHLNPGNCTGSCDYLQGDTFAKGASIDQMVADYYKGKTSTSSLVLGILPTAERPSRYISYSAAGKVIPLATNPYTVFDAVFKDLVQGCDPNKPIDSAAIAKNKARRKSILDTIKGDLADAVRLAGLNPSEKAKLEAYTDSIRQIEQTLEGMATSSVSPCESLKSFIGQPKIEVKAENYMKVARLMMDLVVAAFQLDVTRSATIVWSVGGVNGVPSTWEKFENGPINESYHALTHQQADPKNWQEKCRILDKYHAGEFAYLLGQLKSYKEGNATLLDNSLALWTSEIGEGSTHTSQNIPFILAGKAAGAMKSGRYLPLPKTEHQGALISILNAMGMTDKKSIGRATNPKSLLA